MLTVILNRTVAPGSFILFLLFKYTKAYTSSYTALRRTTNTVFGAFFFFFFTPESITFYKLPLVFLF